MKTPNLRIKWDSPKGASKWPVGSVVLLRRPQLSNCNYGAWEVITWHRPDWMQLEEYKDAKFALIERREPYSKS